MTEHIVVALSLIESIFTFKYPSNSNRSAVS